MSDDDDFHDVVPNKRWTLAELQCDAKLRDRVETQRMRWEAKFKHHPPSERELNEFERWAIAAFGDGWVEFYSRHKT